MMDRLADDRRPMGPDATGSINSIGTGGSIGPWGEGEQGSHNDAGERNAVHFQTTSGDAKHGGPKEAQFGFSATQFSNTTPTGP
jgi:hypothetical protein